MKYVVDAKAKKTEADRVAITTMNASKFNDEIGTGNVPDITKLYRRLTLDLHTREVLGEININRKIRKSIKNGDNPLGGKIPGGPKDILTYFFTKQSASNEGEGSPTSHGKGLAGGASSRKASPRSATAKGGKTSAVPSHREMDEGKGDPSAPEAIEPTDASKRPKGASSSGGENR